MVTFGGCPGRLRVVEPRWGTGRDCRFESGGTLALCVEGRWVTVSEETRVTGDVWIFGGVWSLGFPHGAEVEVVPGEKFVLTGLQPQPGSGARVAPQQSPILPPG